MDGRRLGGAVLLLVAACNAAPREDSGTTGTTIDNAIAGDGRGPALSIVTPFVADTRCAQGGQAVQSGFDDDGDGLLSDEELSATTVLCSAADGGGPSAGPPADELGPCAEPSSLSTPALSLNVEGTGYFVLAGAEEGTRFYTRALDLHVDDTGHLRDAHGLQVLGHRAGSTALAPLEAAPPVRTARATGTIQLALNLASDAALSAPWTGGSPRGESSFSTQLTVFDSGGAARPVDLYFARTGERAYTWHAVIAASELADPGGYEAGTAELVFDAQGRLSAGELAAFDVSFLGAAPDQRLRIDFTGSTSLARPSFLVTGRQDGYAVGALDGYDVSDDGRVLASYTSGSPLSLGLLALASLRPDAAVVRACQGLWQSQGEEPAGVVLATPGSSGLGRVLVSAR